MTSEQHLPDETVKQISHFTDQVARDLLDPANVCYFDIQATKPHDEQITGINQEQLQLVPAKPGVYAIWTRTGTVVTSRYIGHTAGPTARNRLKNHFFKKHPRTGSQLDKVKRAVADGHTVGFTFVALYPPLIRLYVESALINRFPEACPWNIHSRGPRQTQQAEQ